jgi:RNA polymerase sigma factor (sigma-70 family)
MHQPSLQRLFDELSAALVLYARQWCDTPDDAVQEAFIDLANSPAQPDSPKAWLYTTTRRKAQNIARAENRRRRHHRLASEQQPTDGEQWFATSSNPLEFPPEDIMRSLEALPSEARELVVARVWGELNYEQLAELLGCSVSSAHRRYQAALKCLKDLLTEGGGTDAVISSDRPSRVAINQPAGAQLSKDNFCCDTARYSESDQPTHAEPRARGMDGESK